MKILNAMLGRGLGGIEQAFLDYGDALALAGHEVHALIHPGAAVFSALVERDIPVHMLANWGAWDPFAIVTLKALLHAVKPDASIAHGNRALSLLARAGAKKLATPLHNYKIKCAKADAVLYPTRDLMRYAQSRGVEAARLFSVPNLVRIGEPKKHTPHNPPVIGSMGRFVSKKGFDVFIDALALLAERGVAFQAVLGGGGEEETALRALAEKKKLGDKLRFLGWVEDKAAFFDSIDIFCLPSHHEPFGIVLLEAMASGLAVVATASEGPSEIIENGINGVLVNKGDAGLLASALAVLAADPVACQHLGNSGLSSVRERYDMSVVSAKLDLALHVI